MIWISPLAQRKHFGVSWKGVPIDELVPESGEWTFAPGSRYFELRTAREWGKSPSEFRALSDEDKAEMFALTIVENQMRSVETEDQKLQMRLAEAHAREAGRR